MAQLVSHSLAERDRVMRPLQAHSCRSGPSWVCWLLPAAGPPQGQPEDGAVGPVWPGDQLFIEV